MPKLTLFCLWISAVGPLGLEKAGTQGTRRGIESDSDCGIDIEA